MILYIHPISIVLADIHLLQPRVEHDTVYPSYIYSLSSDIHLLQSRVEHDTVYSSNEDLRKKGTLKI